VSDSYNSRSGSTALPEDLEGRPPALGTGDTIKRLIEQLGETWRQITGRISFWTVVLAAAALSSIYYFIFAESMYDSNTIVSVQNKSAISTGATSVLGSVLSSGAGGVETEQLYDYVTSMDMLKLLDKQFHLRQLYSSPQRNPFWRLWFPESDDRFLTFYQSMVLVVPDTTNSLLTIDVLDYDAKRAKAIAQAIIAQSQKFVNDQADVMQKQTMQFAQNELQNAVKAVQSAKIPYQQSIAEMRLSAAQSALATATGMANQQQMFIIPVSVPTLPTNTTRPERLLDIAGIVLVAAMTYAVAFLMWANVRDHRK
jgi:capsule polysaccharide export protein KpsE/RkpR